MLLARAETVLVKVVTRILLEGGETADAVASLEDGYRLERLSDALGQAAPRAFRRSISQQRLATTRARASEPRGADFIAPFNFLLSLCRLPTSEAPLFERLARIGVGLGERLTPPCRRRPCATPSPTARSRARWPASRPRRSASTSASTAGRCRCICAATAAAWPRTRSRCCNRAAAARYAIWGVDAEEGLYMVSDEDSEGRPLDGASHAFTIRFDRAPPVQAFWSFTVYDAATRLLVEHPSGRYAVRDRDPGLQRDAAGGFVLQLQHREPADGANANWLPVPARPFQVVARLYWPQPELLDGRYRPPGIEQVD